MFCLTAIGLFDTWKCRAIAGLISAICIKFAQQDTTPSDHLNTLDCVLIGYIAIYSSVPKEYKNITSHLHWQLRSPLQMRRLVAHLCPPRWPCTPCCVVSCLLSSYIVGRKPSRYQTLVHLATTPGSVEPPAEPWPLVACCNHHPRSPSHSSTGHICKYQSRSILVPHRPGGPLTPSVVDTLSWSHNPHQTIRGCRSKPQMCIGRCGCSH